MSRIQIYYDTTATAIHYSVVRLNDGAIWNETTSAFVANTTAGLTFADTLVEATAIPVIGGWDIVMPKDGMGVYQLAIYKDVDPATVVNPVQPKMGQVVYVQSGGMAEPILLK